ncbi:MAG: hypothetical protein HY290_05380 [Planctomycetia bacterium]|nr:hypothetical protein [Planctomycetia bacterium]
MNRFYSAGLATTLLFTLITIACPDEPPKSDKKAAAKTVKVEAGDITLNVPESWKQKARSGLRVAEFEVPPAGDDKEPGEFVVFFFGKNQGGSVPDNAKRWIGQVEEEGRKVRIVCGESSNGKYTTVDLTGAYNKSVGPPIAKKSKRLPGWRVINVALETKAGTYFLKLDGPAKTIAAIESDFRTAYGGKSDSEKETKVEDLRAE